MKRFSSLVLTALLFTACSGDATENSADDTADALPPPDVAITTDEGVSVEQKLVQKTKTAKGLVCEAIIEYPVVSNLSNTEAQQRMNQQLYAAFVEEHLSLLDDCVTNNADLVEADQELRERTIVNYSMTTINDDYLSLHLTGTRDVEGTAHPGVWADGFTFNLDTGYSYDIQELFDPSVNVRENLEQLVMANLIQQDIQVSTDERMPIEKFYIQDNELVLIELFDSHALQGMDVRLSARDLGSMLLSSGPLTAPEPEPAS